ncbi:MAG: TonB-dependent receptor [Archangium sp.]|nr:TonB-dependent receptor [Archangium sp.]MDP3576169.1 TonB-dependent receptor [Archangium sp.]
MRHLPLLLALALAVPAFADNTADEADVAFDLGNKAYARRDYDAALASYFLSYRLVPNRNVLFNIARCYEAIDRLDEAYRYWNDLFVDPSLPEADRRDVKQALARLAPKVALVTITSTPPGAELYVDRKDLGSRGRTPQTIAVSPGAHTLLLELSGYRPGSVKLTAARGRETKLAAPLVRVEGSIAFTGTPEGAVIRESADGAELGRVPVTLSFPPGQRLLVVQAPGHSAQQVLVDVKADETIAAKVALSEKPRPTGKVIVTSNRENSVVRVDGRDFGFTPTVLTLAVGDYTVEVSSEEVTPLVQPVKVTENSETRVTAELRYAPPKVGAASKQAVSVDDAPASVTVITREELRAFGYQTLAEALQGVRGFFLADDRIYTYVGVRGFQPPGDLNTRILVLWDGHPINDVWAGQAFTARDLEPDLSAVDRIEVVRGPASILFGTGAFFGVINVVPRARVGDQKHVEAVLGAGGQNGVKARVTGSLGQDGASLMLTGAGMLSEGAPFTELGSTTVRGLDGERAFGAAMKAEWNGFTLSGKLNQRRKQIPTAPLGASVGVPGTEYTDVRGFAELRYEKAWERVTLTARGAYDASRYRGWFAQVDTEGNRARTTDTGGADWLSGEVRVAATLFAGNRLTGSLEAQGQFVTQRPQRALAEDPHTRVLLSATLLDEWQVISRLFIQAGIRVDKYFDLDGIALSPRGAIVAKLYDGGITKLVVGRAFRAPTIYETTFSDAETLVAPVVPPRPELITTFEGEHSHDLTRELRITAGGYFNLIDQLVVLTEETLETPACGSIDEPAQCLSYGNSPGRLTAGGAEIELRWQPSRFTLVDASYSFVMLGGADITGGAYPMHVASLRAMVPLKEGLVRLSGQGVFQSGRRAQDGTYAGEAFLLNFGLSGEYGPIRYFAGVQNLLDQRYVVPVLSETAFSKVPQYGRTFFIELSAGF